MDIKTWEERLDAKPDDVCGCGYPLFCFIGNEEYKWCPNCNRDDGSGGAGGTSASSSWW